MISRLFKTALLGVLLCVQALPADAQDVPVRYRVAACDWMMLKRQKLGAFALAKEIGADGVELDMGPLGKRVLFENKLRDEAQVSKFKHVADSLGIEVPSIAMSGFFAQNFMSRDNYRDLVSDGLETARRFGSKVIFLPLGGSGHEWKQKGAQRDTLVSRLRVAGTMAQTQGVTIGIRTQLPAKETIRLLKEIGSPAVKVYYNFQDAADNHRCIVKELKQLGRDRIIQIHASNTDSVNLREDPEIDLPKIKKTLDEMGWNGWLVVERSRDANRVRDVRYNFGRNVAYLKEVFGIP
jgi:sugar phosphate isomerase/epimerase